MGNFFGRFGIGSIDSMVKTCDMKIHKKSDQMVIEATLVKMAKHCVDSGDFKKLEYVHTKYLEFCEAACMSDDKFFDVCLHCMKTESFAGVRYFMNHEELYTMLENCVEFGSINLFVLLFEKMKDDGIELTPEQKKSIKNSARINDKDDILWMISHHAELETDE